MSYNDSCPHCVAERVHATLNAEAPPAPCHRHVESDPKQTLRNELTQCQYCFKSKGPGVDLRKCAACKVDLYCSKECQKSAWKTHKSKCALNQRTNAFPVEKEDLLKMLRSFTSKHRPTIAARTPPAPKQPTSSRASALSPLAASAFSRRRRCAGS
ncbi:hypothetical protein C8R46DRAFT_1114977 [Mycena filopes]|nr:hypothetical protein C8R46DRAFT_1114977 [Mycena filopes]